MVEPDSEPDSEPPKPPKRRGILPPIDNTADFIVFLFACTVATILVFLAIGLVVAAFRGGDVKSYFTILTSIVTSIISALVGYLAGRGGKPPEVPPP